MPDNAKTDVPDDNDVVITYMDERDGLDVYRVTKGPTVIGEFIGLGIGSSVLHIAVEHAEPGRSVWVKDEDGVRRVNPF